MNEVKRDYKREAALQKQKYVRIEAKLDKDEYGDILNHIKEHVGLTQFIKDAIKKYERKLKKEAK